jgi:hypothetical protein
LDIYLSKEEPLRVFNFIFCVFTTFTLTIVHMLLRGKWTEIAWFLPILAGKSSERPPDSHWAQLKEYREGAGKCPRVTA